MQAKFIKGFPLKDLEAILQVVRGVDQFGLEHIRNVHNIVGWLLDMFESKDSGEDIEVSLGSTNQDMENLVSSLISLNPDNQNAQSSTVVISGLFELIPKELILQFVIKRLLSWLNEQMGDPLGQ